MKTKELIRQLQKADPSGELDCCLKISEGFGHPDIHFVSQDPAYWDGPYERLVRNESNPYYNIIGGEIVREGRKVYIRPLTIAEAIFEDPDLPVTFVGESPSNKFLFKQVEESRERTRVIDYQVSEKTVIIGHAGERYLLIDEEWTPKKVIRLFDRQQVIDLKEEFGPGHFLVELVEEDAIILDDVSEK